MPVSSIDKNTNAAGDGWRRREFLTNALALLAGSSLLTIPHRAGAALPPIGAMKTAYGLSGAGMRSGVAGAGMDPGTVGADIHSGAGGAGVHPGTASSGVHPGMAGAGTVSHQGLSIRQVIDRILADIPGAPFDRTVDTIKTGSADQPVKGIVTTMFATDAVIEKTIQLGANFIIAHEPTFYNHMDETDWLGDDVVFRFKKDLLDKHGIVVWRFHDYWHAHRPDGILMGVLTALGWEKFYNANEPNIITVPAISLGDIVGRARKQLEIEKVKVIGDLSQSCQRIVISPGAAGGRSQIGQLQKYHPDLLIVGELNEWETAEYVRDFRYQGGKTSLVVLGHSVSEEPGMQWLLPWLQPKTPGVTITHVPSGDPFSWV